MVLEAQEHFKNNKSIFNMPDLTQEEFEIILECCKDLPCDTLIDIHNKIINNVKYN